MFIKLLDRISRKVFVSKGSPEKNHTEGTFKIYTFQVMEAMIILIIMKELIVKFIFGTSSMNAKKLGQILI
jgi:hypothetical protein